MTGQQATIGRLLQQGNWPRLDKDDAYDDLLNARPGGLVRTRRFTGGWSLSDLPRDLPDPPEPVEDEPEPEQPSIPLPPPGNAQIQGGEAALDYMAAVPLVNAMVADLEERFQRLRLSVQPDAKHE